GEADLALARTLPDPEVLAFEALVPAKAFGKGFRAVPPQGKAAVLLGRPHVLLAAGGPVARVQAGDARFVDVDSVLPRKPVRVSFRVDPDRFVELLRAAGEVARKTAEVPAVEILYWSAGQPIGVTSRGDDGVTFDGLIMPLTPNR